MIAALKSLIKKSLVYLKKVKVCHGEFCGALIYFVMFIRWC